MLDKNALNRVRISQDLVISVEMDCAAIQSNLTIQKRVISLKMFTDLELISLAVK